MTSVWQQHTCLSVTVAVTGVKVILRHLRPARDCQHGFNRLEGAELDGPDLRAAVLVLLRCVPLPAGLATGLDSVWLGLDLGPARS